jgi:hypothetical protein
LLDLKDIMGDVEVRPAERFQYSAALEDPAGLSNRYSLFDFPGFSKTDKYISWQNSSTSCLLLLKGKTQNNQTGFSFLSPAALAVLKQVENNKDFNTTYCFVETSAWLKPGRVPYAYLVISKIIWQLLKQNPDLIQDPGRLRNIRNRIQHADWKKTCPKIPCDVLIELLSEIPKTYIILDRIDRCDCFSVNFLEQLFRVIRECQTVVKIFVVLCETSAKDFRETDLNTEGVRDKFLIVTTHQKGKHIDRSTICSS